MFIIIIIIINNTTNISNNTKKLFHHLNSKSTHFCFLLYSLLLLSYETTNIVTCDNSDALCTQKFTAFCTYMSRFWWRN